MPFDTLKEVLCPSPQRQKSLDYAMSDKLPACRCFRQRATWEAIDKLEACRTSSEEDIKMNRADPAQRRNDGLPPPAFRTPQVAPAIRQPTARAPLGATLIVVSIALLAAAAVGTIAWLRMGPIDWSRLSPWSDRTSPTPVPNPRRTRSDRVLSRRGPLR
jgi:hypothetical protein